MKDASNLLGVEFVSRIMVPYGPDESKGETYKDAPYSGYAYGVDAADRSLYDSKNQYFYTLSGKSHIVVTDFSDAYKPFVTEYAAKAGEKNEGFDACFAQELLLVGSVFEEENEAGESVEKYRILAYSAVNRDNPKSPTLLTEIEVVSEPGFLLSSNDCSIMAVAHSNPGDGISNGSITIIKGLEKIRSKDFKPQVYNIPLDGDGAWDDAYLLSKGINMPMTKNSLTYWDDYSHMADELDFSELRANYRPSIFMSPEALNWGNPEQTELLVNMQPNNGVLRFDVVSGKMLDIVGFGLKNHEKIPIDINSHDKTCNLDTYEHLFAMRGPDNFQVIRYNDKTYLITCNEGEESSYQSWNEIVTAKEIFNGTNFGLKNMEVPKKVFDPENPTAGASAKFNSNCEGSACVGNVGIGMGSNAIDYESDPTRPIFHRMVLHGGRGWSIYELPENPSDLVKLVYDSADTVERGGCEQFPWAHNGIQDWQVAPADNLGNNTLYQSLEEGEEDREILEAFNDPLRDGCLDQGNGQPGACPLSKYVDVLSDTFGSSVEAAAIGVACGRLVTVVATEKSSLALMYDITEINAPSVVQIFHLSPVSETTSAGFAFNEGTIGDVVTRKVVFLSASESPTGKPSLMFPGGQSGTISFYEIKCAVPDDASDSDQNESWESGDKRQIRLSLLGMLATLVIFLGM